uniref:Integrase catalytic domain-containing protein n=1 Tax=Trichogramma kaykai TaxID=54128 RepID=A0ABD2WE14_9HYME
MCIAVQTYLFFFFSPIGSITTKDDKNNENPNEKIVHLDPPSNENEDNQNGKEPKDSQEDDSEWYVQMQESSMRSELLLQTVNRNTGELQQILKGLLQAVHSTHELNKTMVEQQSKMNSTLNTLATSIQSLSIAFREEKARQRQYREKVHNSTSISDDNGTEFTGGKFSEIIDEEKATFDFAPPHTPQLNGTAERFNKTIQNKIRALMFDSGLPESMWSLAADAATYIYNRTPHKSNGFKTPLSLMNKNIKSSNSPAKDDTSGLGGSVGDP